MKGGKNLNKAAAHGES
uniref:Uncharacterized protein n=1 Tax=Arundo donax TaxID=35708 RepID=A0A0A9C8S3_ARUDO